MDNRSIEIVKLESLKDKDSPYVRPYRFHYIQVMSLKPISIAEIISIIIGREKENLGLCSIS